MILTKKLQGRIKAEIRSQEGTYTNYCAKHKINRQWLSTNVFGDIHLDKTPPARIREIIRELGLWAICKTNIMKKPSKEAKILDHFRKGLSLTEVECIMLFGRSRLASVVNRLENDGIKIARRPVIIKTYNHKLGKWVTKTERYFEYKLAWKQSKRINAIIAANYTRLKELAKDMNYTVAKTLQIISCVFVAGTWRLTGKVRDGELFGVRSWIYSYIATLL